MGKNKCYKKELLFTVIKASLPVSTADWTLVCLKYQEVTEELVPRLAAGIKRYWNDTMCNKFVKIFSFSNYTQIHF